MTKRTEKKRLLDFFKVVRPRKDEIVPANTICIQVSAVNHNDKTNAFKLTDKYTKIESKYVILDPIYHYENEDISYFQLVLNDAYEEWFYRIVGEKINIAIADFDFFIFDYHVYKSDRNVISRNYKTILDEIENTKRDIESLQNIKKYLLNKMFV